MTAEPSLASGHAVATPHYLASAAASSLMERGGTAVDGAIAAAAVLAVVYPNQCAIGGDVIALLAEPGSAPVAVNGSGRAPHAIDVELVRRTSGQHMPWYGVHSITVPGAVSAWQELHRRGGRLPWADLLEPAIGAASQGVPVSPGLSRALRAEARRLLDDPGLASVFAPDGRVLVVGQNLVQPALARTLAVLAASGPAALYEGEIGGAMVSGLRSRGCSLSVDDLAQHICDVQPSMSTGWGAERIHVAPPNSQGFVLLQILGALRRSGDLDPLGKDADVLTRLFAATAADRDRHLSDPLWGEVPVDELLSDAHLDRLVRDAGTGASRPGKPSPQPTGDTVAVVTADAEGRFVSLIESVYMAFGSGILEPQTGILLHDRGAGFSLDPSSPNVLRGGARPAHTLMPVLVSRDGVVVGAHGTRGGSAQPQIHAQVLLRMQQGMRPSDAVAAPRWVLSPLDDEGLNDDLLVEADLSPKALRALGQAGHVVHHLEARHDAVGHAMVVRATPTGLAAGSDPRADGATP
ncbi:MAG: gamma-glutamyltransferase [Actinomycetes bacterium]